MQKRFVLSLAAVFFLTATFAFAYTAEQANQGATVYTLKCAVCHGENGQGGQVPKAADGYAGMKAPPVAGPGALPSMQTAENVYTFIKNHMPLGKPGSLTKKDALNIVAFDLKANNIEKPGKQPLKEKDLRSIKIHPGS